MADDAFGDLDLTGRHVPGLGGGGDQHRPRGGAGIAHLHPAVRHRGRSARAHRPESEVLVERVVGRREFDPHLRPIGIHLVGDDRRQAGRRPLAEFDMLDDHADGVVGQHADKGVGGEGRPGRRHRLGAAHWQHQAENQAGTGEKLAAVGSERGHADTFAPAAASLIA